MSKPDSVDQATSEQATSENHSDPGSVGSESVKAFEDGGKKATADSTPMIELRSVGRHYQQGNVDAVDDVSFSIPAGQYVAILGKSGSGKTTLLNLIGGLDQATSGEILFEGKRLQGSRSLDEHRSRHIGFVFQSYYLLPNLTAAENVQIPMFESDESPAGRSKRASDLLEQVGLSGRQGHLPAELSGGECQRVAIARALANQPRVVLADEPTGALDSETGESILDLLERLVRSEGITLLVVTHDESVAARAERRIQLADGKLVSESN